MSSVRQAYFAQLATLPPVSSPLRQSISAADDDSSPSSSPLPDPAELEAPDTIPPSTPPSPLEQPLYRSSTARHSRGNRRRPNRSLRIAVVHREALSLLPEDDEDDEEESASSVPPTIDVDLLKPGILSGGYGTQEDGTVSDPSNDNESDSERESDDDSERMVNGNAELATDDGSEVEVDDAQYDDESLARIAQATLYDIESPPFPFGCSTWGSLAAAIQFNASQSIDRLPPQADGECWPRCQQEGSMLQSAKKNGDSDTDIPRRASAEQMARRRIAPVRRRLFGE